MPVTSLPDQLRPWLFEQLARGLPPGRLVQALEGEGLAPAVAARMVREVLMRPTAPSRAPGKAADPSVPTDFWPRDFPFGHTHEAEFDGHRVRLLARLADPAVALLDQVLSLAECDALIAAAQPRLARSAVVDPAHGGYRAASERSSEGTSLTAETLPLISRLQARMAWITGMSVRHAEPLQVLRYRVGGEYLPHHDYFDLPSAEGGQRCATLVTYLTDVDTGGATTFPELGLRFTPRRGMAVYFAYADGAGRLDSRCLHGGAAVGDGEKWIATQWMRSQVRG